MLNATLRTLTKREYWEKFSLLAEKVLTDSRQELPVKNFFLSVKTLWGLVSDKTEDLPQDLVVQAVERYSKHKKHVEPTIKLVNEVYGGDEPSEDTYTLSRKFLLEELTKDILVRGLKSIASQDFQPTTFVKELEQVEEEFRSDQPLELFSPDLVDSIIAQETNVVKYPTGITTLDEELQGGLWGSEFAVVQGETYLGKTALFIHMGCTALRDMKPLIYCTGDMTKARVYIRFYQNLLRKSRVEIVMDPEASKKSLSELDLPPWTIVDFSNRQYSAWDFRSDVLRFADQIGEPPLVILDYLDKLSELGGDSFWRDLTKMSQICRRTACEVEGGVWTASQINRPAYGKSRTRKGDVAGSLGKVEEADVFIALGANDTERACGIRRLTIEKAKERVVTKPEILVNLISDYQTFVDEDDPSWDIENWRD